jgi:hypothetical protein
MLTAILGIGGALLGGLSAFSNSWKAKEQAEQNLAQQQKAWELQKAEGQYQAKTASENLSQNYQNQMTGFNQGLEGQAMQNAQAQMSLSQQMGMADAAAGMSGTRENPSADVNMNTQQNMLSQQIGLQNDANVLGVTSMGQQMGQQAQAIQHQSESYEAGGYAYETNQLQQQQYKDAVTEASDPIGITANVLGGAVQGAQTGIGLAGIFMRRSASTALGKPKPA